MRIISGNLKGRRLQVPSNLPVRPTTDFARTGIFNVMANHFDFGEVRVLDLFSGTGGMTFEFISRGCGSIEAVDNNYHCVKFIRDTAVKFGVENVKVHKAAASAFMRNTEQQYDIIFADPPYNRLEILHLPMLAFERNLVAPGGWFILEHQSVHDLKGMPHYKDKRVYGNVGFSIFANEENA